MDRICLRCADAALLEPLEEAARELGLPLEEIIRQSLKKMVK